MSETVPPLAIMKANEEVSKICEQQQDAYVTPDTPPRLINVEHFGDIDLEPSSESLNLLKSETR